MRVLVEEMPAPRAPEEFAARLRREPGLVLLRSGLFDPTQARYSVLAARPFLTLRSRGNWCETRSHSARQVRRGNPWRMLAELLPRYAQPDAADLPFPAGGAFGFWGYDLKNFLEPRLPRRAERDVRCPDCHVGFYDSVAVFDHQRGSVAIVATGLAADGSRSAARAEAQRQFWRERLTADDERAPDHPPCADSRRFLRSDAPRPSSLSRGEFLAAVERAQRYIRAGDIYQVNLAHRLTVEHAGPAWELFRRLLDVSPAPFAAFLDAGDVQLASSSPELFLRLSGRHVRTRPIKGTRPRDTDPTRDAQLAYQLQTSPKEQAELVMITDLLRNDLGRVCEYGSVQVPDLARLERFAQVQHLVSTVEGRLRPGLTHLDALAACFPGGSITGAPKIRAMEIIDELEPVARGPYTGALGYLGFNGESQFNILIRTAVCCGGRTFFHVGAGIVADSVPEMEYEETLAKAAGFLAALGRRENSLAPSPIAATTE